MFFKRKLLHFHFYHFNPNIFNGQNMSQFQDSLKFIIVDENHFDLKLIERCYNDLLFPSFGQQLDELDSFEDFSSSIKNTYETLFTRLILILDESKDILAGCAVFENYKKSNFVLNSYIVVNSDYRGKKLSNALVTKMVEILPNKDTILILETDDSSVKKSSLDVKLRLKIHSQLGYELIDFEYIQSKLRPGGSEVNDLLLLVHSSRKHLLTKSRLINFLNEFYSITDSSEDFTKMPYWIHMIKSLDKYKDEQLKIYPYGNEWFKVSTYKKSKI